MILDGSDGCSTASYKFLFVTVQEYQSLYRGSSITYKLMRAPCRRAEAGRNISELEF